MDNTQACLRLSLVAAALASAFSPVVAAESDVDRLTKPESTVSVGVGHLSGEVGHFGIYNGLNDEGNYGLFDVNLNRLDEASGTWLKLNGRNLGLDSREIRFEQSRQGDWGYFIDYSRIPRVSPFTPNTGLRGIENDHQTVQTGGKRDIELKTTRDRWIIGVDKQFAGDLDIQVRFRNEEKEGNRLFGRGTTTPQFYGPSAPPSGTFEFLAEPINTTTRELDASIAYTQDRLQLVGGYIGSWFDNHSTSLDVTSSITQPANCQAAANLWCFSPLALPPDNESHQIYLTGGYNFTPSTRGTFKVAYTHATQDDAFLDGTPKQPNTSGRNDLDAEIDTTLVQLGLSARPLPQMTVNATLRYEDRDDKTPIYKYFGNAQPAQGSSPAVPPLPGYSTLDGKNEPRSVKTINGKLDASYQLPMGFRLNGGVDYEEKKRNTSDVRSVGYREKTEETTGRIELRRALSETVTGAVSYAYSNRDGSDFYANKLLGQVDPAYAVGGVTPSNLVAPIHLADRQRDKVKLSIDWNPTDMLSLQFTYTDTHDDYDMRQVDAGKTPFGVEDGKAKNYSVDASYRLADAWQLTGWASRDDSTINQVTCGGIPYSNPPTATCFSPLTTQTQWSAKLRNLGEALGLGLKGKVTEKLEIGANAQAAYDTSKYDMSRITGTSPVSSLPDIYARKLTFGLFGKYALNTNVGIRVDAVHERWHTDDWTWANYRYTSATDGTTISAEPWQNATFVGVSGYYKWW